MLSKIDFKLLREMKGLSQIDIKEITGITQATLSRLENGHIKTPDFDTVEKYLDAIDLKFIIVNK